MGFSILTVALATSAPEGSCTEPRRVPELLEDWAKVDPPAQENNKRQAQAASEENLGMDSFWRWSRNSMTKIGSAGLILR
jgi:hypothetical protein